MGGGRELLKIPLVFYLVSKFRSLQPRIRAIEKGRGEVNSWGPVKSFGILFKLLWLLTMPIIVQHKFSLISHFYSFVNSSRRGSLILF